jgi:hypothetical protein
MKPTTAAALVLALALTAGLVGVGAAIAGSGTQVLPFGEVNWDKGYVKVSAIGLPPFGATGNVTVQDVARQNAVSLAQKRLLGVVLDMDTRGRKVRDVLNERPELKERLRSLIANAGVAGKSYGDGSVEITLTLTMTGQAGLKTFLGSL